MSLNVVVVGGNLTADPKTRAVGEHKITEFSIAVNEGYGEKKKTSFFNCEAWGKTGETLAQYKKKGDGILVSGRLQQERWEKEGQKHSRVVIVAEKIEFVGNRSDQPETVKDNLLDGGEITLESIPF